MERSHDRRGLFSRGALPAGIVLVLCACLPLLAGQRRYSLDIPDGQPVSFELEFTVDHPGKLVVSTEWSGPRVLSFRLYGPGRNLHRARRSGPSPQILETTVEPLEVTRGRQWRLSIRALPSKGAGKGLLALQLPDPPEVAAIREVKAEPPPPAPPEPDAWAVAAEAPWGASEQQRHLFETVERLRAVVVDENGTFHFDTCRWHSDLLRYLTGWRDRLVRTGELPPVSSRRYLQRLTEAIRAVDEVRRVEDPIYGGPPVGDRVRRKAWMTVRRQKIEKLEAELDALIDSIRRGHAPELQQMDWPGRLVSCVAACERNFEQRPLVGESRASNAEVAETQWGPILAAAEALDALVYLTAPESGR